MECPMTPPKPVDRQRHSLKQFVAIMVSLVAFLLLAAAYFGTSGKVPADWLQGSEGHTFSSMIRDEPDSRFYLRRAARLSGVPKTADHVVKLPFWALRGNERRLLNN